MNGNKMRIYGTRAGSLQPFVFEIDLNGTYYSIGEFTVALKALLDRYMGKTEANKDTGPYIEWVIDQDML